jgi:hypothetical protein
MKIIQANKLAEAVGGMYKKITIAKPTCSDFLGIVFIRKQ